MQPSEYDYAGAFEISQVEGVIRTVRQLDREQVEVIRLGLVCEDIEAATEKQTATATLTLIVEDTNDNDPQFRKSFYRRSVAENAKKGTTIVTVVADDVDKNRTITYSLQVSCFTLVAPLRIDFKGFINVPGLLAVKTLDVQYIYIKYINSSIT